MDVLHEHLSILEECGGPWGRGFVSQVSGYWTRKRLAGGNLELGAVHGAGENGAVERAHLERRIHVPTAPVQRVEGPCAITDDELAPVQFDGLHSAGDNLGGLDSLDKRVTQGPSPLPTAAAGCLDRSHPGERTTRTSSVASHRNARGGRECTGKRSAYRARDRAEWAGRDKRECRVSPRASPPAQEESRPDLRQG